MRRNLFVSLVVATGTSMVAAGAGGAQEVPTATTSVAAVATSPAVLPASASVDTITEVITPILGPTIDVVAGLAVLHITPRPGIPTPEGSSILEFGIFYEADTTGTVRYALSVYLTSSADAADLVALYQTEMATAGFAQTGDAIEIDADGNEIRRLDYVAPSVKHEDAVVSIGILDSDQDIVEISLAHTADPAVMDAFTSWPSGPACRSGNLDSDG